MYKFLKRFISKLTAISLLALITLPFFNSAHAAGATLRVELVPVQASCNIYDGGLDLVPVSATPGNAHHC